MKNYIYRRAEFLLSAHLESQFPPDKGKELAFAGRSNSGKSSVINVITGKKSLARVSKRPGRTQQINFFRLTDETRLVDLPGYGYAGVPGELKTHWASLINTYLSTRRSLKGLIVVVDIRRQLTDYDEQLLAWSRKLGIPVHVLLNKCDKLSRSAAQEALTSVSRELDTDASGVQLFSALNKTGTDEICTLMNAWLR